MRQDAATRRRSRDRSARSETTAQTVHAVLMRNSPQSQQTFRDNLINRHTDVDRLVSQNHPIKMSFSSGNPFFTAQCTLVQMRGLGIASRPSVRPSVCNVGDL